MSQVVFTTDNSLQGITTSITSTPLSTNYIYAYNTNLSSLSTGSILSINKLNATSTTLFTNLNNISTNSMLNINNLNATSTTIFTNLNSSVNVPVHMCSYRNLLSYMHIFCSYIQTKYKHI